MDKLGNAGIIAAILTALACIIIFAVILIKMSNKGGRKEKYDERQMVARGKGYTYAFYTAAIVAIIPCFLSEGVKTFMGDVLFFCPLLAGIVVHVTYCIFNDAYLDMNLKPRQWISVLTCIGFANLLLGILNTLDGLVENGSLKIAVINLIMGIIFVIVLLEIFIKSRLDAKEVEEDEESEA